MVRKKDDKVLLLIVVAVHVCSGGISYRWNPSDSYENYDVGNSNQQVYLGTSPDGQTRKAIFNITHIDVQK
ncbi:hypothetical protein RB195_004459 [Necator americanus]